MIHCARWKVSWLIVFSFKTSHVILSTLHSALFRIIIVKFTSASVYKHYVCFLYLFLLLHVILLILASHSIDVMICSISFPLLQAPIEDQSFLWSDKYRPRKPRFFNRVHTGFEWNKYNQTHYDIDNPPPKIVQGYKFNIFYPDLIDKSATPSYTLTDDENDRDFAILRFKAGPPYEDIAFRIVKRDWELSYKRGFRCQFHNNVFQLWFHFKRYRYRRWMFSFTFPFSTSFEWIRCHIVGLFLENWGWVILKTGQLEPVALKRIGPKSFHAKKGKERTEQDGASQKQGVI